jgi:glycyl-tRNA synthetase beta subunit
LKLNAKDDLVSAVLHIKSGNICEEYKVLKLLENILSNNKTLFFTFKRVINVVESNIKQDLEIKKEFLNPIENKLLNEIIVLEKAIKSFYDSNNSANLVAVCISIEEIVNDLFKDTIILDKNLEIQKHRISVLHKLYCEFKKIADFSLIDL